MGHCHAEIGPNLSLPQLSAREEGFSGFGLLLTSSICMAPSGNLKLRHDIRHHPSLPYQPDHHRLGQSSSQVTPRVHANISVQRIRSNSRKPKTETPQDQNCDEKQLEKEGKRDMKGGGYEKEKMGFEETELRLGLPGGGEGGGEAVRKRGFSETVDLKLNLSSKQGGSGEEKVTGLTKEKNLLLSATDPAKPPAKAQVVGWPPVRSFRKNILATASQRSSSDESGGEKAAFVKVSMDGAPYLRKVDLRMYTSYHQLSDALAKMLSSFTIGNCGSQGVKDFMNESKLMDLLNGSDYVPTYEDKDGDWMLVGDVPWEMFVESCKRLRIMKGTEAIGLAPKAVEKCKKRG
ncbi:hypothetical protein V6N12_074237 [Hibiscus sabdariffa]|uniref:Auxin-responsive protein n=1 Tax=Hibiscus sabdariffa TaxID=183260 RepID=A0ABR2BGX5_9ROSI